LIFAISLLLVGLILLSSKMVFFLFVGYAILETISLMQVSIGYKIWIILIGGLVILVSLAFLGSSLRNRLMEVASTDNLEILKESSANDFNKVNGLTLRLMFWKWGLGDAPLDSYLLGQGTGDVQDYLNRTYERHNLAITISAQERYGYYGYNTHNQYVETFLKSGVLGLVSMVLLLVVTFRTAISGSNRLLTYLAIEVLIICLSECFFETNKGIVFSSLFISLLCVRYPSFDKQHS
jgi:O-antigen ligase